MYAFIVNPNARSGLGMQVWRKVESLLEEQAVEYKLYFTRYPGQATDFAKALTSSDTPPTIVVLGGDGTMNEVVCGIENLEAITLGYIPIGSSNDFARSMGIPKNPQRALEQILNPRKYAYVNIGILSGNDISRRFVVSSGLGFDADVCFHNRVSRLKKMMNRLHLGKISYTAVAISRLIKMHPGTMSLVLDNGKKRVFKHVIFAAAMNHRYEGGGFKFCPSADPGDDIIDVIIVSRLPKYSIPLLLPSAFIGIHRFVPGIFIYTCRQFEVQSDHLLPLHADGEAVAMTDSASFSLEKEKLRVIIA